MKTTLSRKLRLIAIAVAGLLISACASHLSYSDMQALMPPQPADMGRIYFYREASYVGNLVTPDIVVNGQLVGASNPGTFFYIDREPGEYRVVCGAGDYSQAAITLPAGKSIYVRTSVGKGSIVKSTMILEPVDVAVAIPEIHDLKYVATK